MRQWHSLPDLDRFDVHLAKFFHREDCHVNGAAAASAFSHFLKLLGGDFQRLGEILVLRLDLVEGLVAAIHSSDPLLPGLPDCFCSGFDVVSPHVIGKNLPTSGVTVSAAEPTRFPIAIV